MKLFPFIKKDQLGKFEVKDLPPALPLKMILGPSVVLLALGIGSGEYVLWPNLVAKYGFVCFWAAAVGLLTQFFINMEIERWTLATGESILVGFSRFSKAWSWLFLFFVMIPFVWPGWGAGAFQCVTFVTGGSHVWLTVIGMVVIGSVLTLSPRAYTMMERIQLGLVGFIVLALIGLTLPYVNGELLTAWAKGTVSVGRLPEAADFDWPLFLGALAYAGLGGVGNIIQSNYIREKGYGMGYFAPKVVSPFTGKETAVASKGFQFEGSEENLKNWKAWWRVANIEHFLSFFVLGLITMSMLAWLAYATIYQHPELGTGVMKDLDFLRLQGTVIGTRFGEIFRTGFYLIGFAVLFTTQLGVLDLVARLLTDLIRVTDRKVTANWTESRVYFTVLWTMIGLGIMILLSGFSQPRLLLILGACINATVMALYTLLLLYCNWTAFAPPVRPSGLRVAALLWAFVFYGYFAAVTLTHQLKYFVRHV